MGDCRALGDGSVVGRDMDGPREVLLGSTVGVQQEGGADVMGAEPIRPLISFHPVKTLKTREIHGVHFEHHRILPRP